MTITPPREERPTRRRRTSGAERRAAIDAAARALALRDGLQNVTHRSIAKHLDLTNSLVVHHAPDISIVRGDACGRLLREEFTAIRALVADCAAAVEKLACLIRTVGTAGREDAAGVWFDGWSIGRRDPRTAAIVRAEMDEWQAFVAQILADGAEQGEFDLDSPQSVAWEFVALLDGLSAHTLVSYGDPADYPTLLASPLAARLGVPVSALVDEQADSTARPKPVAHRQQEAP